MRSLKLDRKLEPVNQLKRLVILGILGFIVLIVYTFVVFTNAYHMGANECQALITRNCSQIISPVSFEPDIVNAMLAINQNTSQANYLIVLAQIIKEFAPEGKKAVHEALLISYRESKWTPTTINTTNSNKTVDYGVFQINSVHKPTLEEMTQIVANVKRAHQIYKGSLKSGCGWSLWSTHWELCKE